MQATSSIPTTTSTPVTSSSVPASTTPAPPTSPPGPCNAVCKPAATLAAQSKCAAQLTAAQLYADIDGGSTGSPTILLGNYGIAVSGEFLGCTPPNTSTNPQ